jgi:hypothetical protein
MVHYYYIINVEKTYMIKMDKATVNLKHNIKLPIQQFLEYVAQKRKKGKETKVWL